MSVNTSLKQIWLSAPHTRDPLLIDETVYIEELRQFRESLLEDCPAWPSGFELAASPLPVLIDRSLTDHLEKLGDILCRAVTSIVERWWTDTAANFPARMPIPRFQEDILRWIDGPGKDVVPPFVYRRGSWRPDFLIEDVERRNNLNGSSEVFELRSAESVQICEINARFSFNAFFANSIALRIFQRKLPGQSHLTPASDPNLVYSAFKKVLNGENVVHLLKGSEFGLDIHLFEHYLRERCGRKVRFIEPKDLRCDANSSLWCKLETPDRPGRNAEGRNLWLSPSGEWLEKVHQVALELHQSELEDLGEDILKALAPICFNDLRAIFLVHDKRMLGIALQELDSLVHEHNVLTVEEGEILRGGIVPTFLPGTQELQGLLHCTLAGFPLQDECILKPIGSGKGEGIIFGSEVTTEFWIESLKRLAGERVDGPLYVVQRRIVQRKYDVIIPDNQTRSDTRSYPFVGTFLMVNGEHLGIAGWRTGPGNICAVSHGGTWICSLVGSQTENPSPSESAVISAYSLSSETHSPPELTTACDISPILLEACPVPIVTPLDIPRIAATDLDDSYNRQHIELVHETLHRNGILIVQLGFEDLKSDYLLQLVQSLNKHHGHGAPLLHSSTRGWFWDVKPSAETTIEEHRARSETMEDFPWHTDCSYASNPPRFFGLHVLQADRCGGGTLSVLQLSKITGSLTIESLEALQAPEFRIEVPREFESGTCATVGPLLTPRAGSELEDMRCRFRADIVQPLTDRASTALAELNRILALGRDTHSDACLNLTPEMLPNGSVVILDNGRWLHARNEVKDAGRHLRRIRWDARDF